jgi:hypothetical protein
LAAFPLSPFLNNGVTHAFFHCSGISPWCNDALKIKVRAVVILSPHSAVPDINITASGVLKLLRNINPNKATGPDTITGRLLKELATEITTALTLIFKASLHQGEIPSICYVLDC